MTEPTVIHHCQNCGWRSTGVEPHALHQCPRCDRDLPAIGKVEPAEAPPRSAAA